MFLTDDRAEEIKFEVELPFLPKIKGVKFVAPAKVALVRWVDERGLHLRISTEVTVEFDCYRCAKHAKRTFCDTSEETFPEKDDYLTWSLRDGVDVKEPVFEAVYHTVPESLLCKDDCLGLCPICGADLNKAKCDCDRSDDEETDNGNPFAVLLKKYGK